MLGAGWCSAGRPNRWARPWAFLSAIVLCVAGLLQLAVLGTALASFAGLKTAGPEALKSAKLATPAGLIAANGGCAGGNQQSNVTASWTGSAELDANANALVSGYTLLRATASAGIYSSVGSTGVSTSLTDVNPSGAETPQVLVGNANAKTVHAVKASTNEAASLVTTGTSASEPNSIAVTPDASKAVLAEGPSHQLQIITVSTRVVGAAVAVPEVAGVKSRPDAVAITPDGKTAYVVDGANNLVYPLTIATSKLGTAIAVAGQGDPGAILITPDGKKAYVANYAAHSVSVIATASNTVSATITIGAGEAGKPIALAATPNSAHVYVADQGSGQVDDMATSSDTVAATIAVASMLDANIAGGGDPNVLAITPDGSKLYLAAYAAGTITDIATSTDTVAKTITLPGVGANPNALALAPNGCQLYVHDHANNQVDAIAVATDTVSATAAVGASGDPTGMSLTPDSTRLYLSNQPANSVSVIATSTNTVSATLGEATVGKEPTAVLATPSQYFYKLQAGHGGWQSALTAAVTATLGFNQGGWQ